MSCYLAVTGMAGRDLFKMVVYNLTRILLFYQLYGVLIFVSDILEGK